jgi:hypothetical protein
MTPTDYRVEYGDRRQFRAWFDDRARAVDFAARHGGVIVPLVPASFALINGATTPTATHPAAPRPAAPR